jgi:hypothetical protein
VSFANNLSQNGEVEGVRAAVWQWWFPCRLKGGTRKGGPAAAESRYLQSLGWKHVSLAEKKVLFLQNPRFYSLYAENWSLNYICIANLKLISPECLGPRWVSRTCSSRRARRTHGKIPDSWDHWTCPWTFGRDQTVSPFQFWKLKRWDSKATTAHAQGTWRKGTSDLEPPDPCELRIM